MAMIIQQLWIPILLLRIFSRPFTMGRIHGGSMISSCNRKYTTFVRKYTTFVRKYTTFVRKYTTFVRKYTTFVRKYTTFVRKYTTFVSHSGTRAPTAFNVYWQETGRFHLK
ncbi:hypothetical protein DPMN_170700 [Dreissena polymorpha]|uniref:Secreted protein n=1 Tax=Dreissena polymorpha TaxID=45954 RepID=A0A9D4IBS0_DREPO|nr:hypothetical protein DPMN_170700 [Dreissena polymorpha]